MKPRKRTEYPLLFEVYMQTVFKMTGNLLMEDYMKLLE